MFDKIKLLPAKLNKNEKGQTFILVSILLLLGSMLIAPLMAHMSTGVKTSTVYEKKTAALYAADAGIEDALWQIECNPLENLFTAPDYDEYDYDTTWSYNLDEQINEADVTVTIKNVWIPKDVTPLDGEIADGIIRTGKLIVTGSVHDDLKYHIQIGYYPGDGEDLRVETVGMWLPPGFSYVADSGNLEADPGEDYYSEPTIEDYSGGEAIVWSFSSLSFSSLPDVDPEHSPMVTDINFEFNSTQPDDTPEALSWITTSGVEDIPMAWDADTKVYQITSKAADIDIEAYSIKSELRELDSAMAGDYFAIGNTLMTATGDDRYRDRLFKESSATIAPEDIPSTARVKAAWLYWSGYFEAGNEIAIFSDSCANFDNWTAGSDWIVSSSEFKGHHSSDDPDRYLTMSAAQDLSAYTGEMVTIAWDQSEGGRLESDDSLEFIISSDGTNWSDPITAFSDDNPTSRFSYTLPEEYLTTNFKMGFCLGPGSFGGSDEYAYIDDIEIIMHDIQVDTVIFNSNEITADEQQLQENNDRAETTGTWSYSCYYDATNLVEQLIDDEELGTNGSGTYTLGHVISERPGYPAYTFEVYPTSEETGYPLGIPATGTTMRDQYTYAGWSLIIIYVSPETTGHQLYLYDDLTFVGSGDDLELPITGFITPEEPEGSRLTCFVGEGDFRYTGDYIEINGNRLSDAVNPSTNVWNSYSNALDDPNQEGIDLDTFNVSNYIDPGDTSATVLLGSNTEIYNSVYIILSFRSITDIGGTVTYLIAE